MPMVIAQTGVRGVKADVLAALCPNTGSGPRATFATTGARLPGTHRLTFDTKGWNHYPRRADRSLSGDVTFFFMGSSLLRSRNF